MVSRASWMRGGSIALVLAIGGVLLGRAASLDAAPPTFSLPTPPPYTSQKVVYHLTSDGGWFDRAHRDHLQSIENHLAAVPELTLAVVLQGDGVSLLRDAEHDPALAARIDRLRARGVRFLICRNTLLGRHLGLANLEGAKPEDVVGAGVAEVTRLEMQGYAYLRF